MAAPEVRFEGSDVTSAISILIQIIVSLEL